MRLLKIVLIIAATVSFHTLTYSEELENIEDISEFGDLGELEDIEEIKEIEDEVLKRTEEITNVAQQTTVSKLQKKLKQDMSYIG